MKITIMHPADQICITMKRIYARQLTTLSGGNLSIVDERGVMWVSPSGIDKASLRSEDIVQVFPDGSFEGKYKPTSEYLIHWEIYKVRPDIKAILHAHPPAMTSMSTLHQVPDTTLYPLAHQLNDDAAIAVYALPGSMELAKRVAEVFEKGSDTAILENHGVFLSSANDIFEAYGRFDELEMNAFIQMNAHVFGRPNGMDVEMIAKFLESDNGQVAAQQSSSCTVEEKMQRKELSKTARRAYENRLFTAVNGVVSARLGEDCFLISPAKRDNELLDPEDFVKVTGGAYEGNRLPDGAASLVRELYRRQPDINTAIIASPPYTMMFAVTGEEYKVNFIPECYGVLFSCRMYPPAELLEKPSRIVEEARTDAPFALVGNYGLVLSASTLHSSYDMLEVCENTAKSIHMARMTDQEIQWMTDQQLKEMDEK
ncbi:MAG: class II aldolase/adducin family protein [Suipraeoptans sp.]